MPPTPLQSRLAASFAGVPVVLMLSILLLAPTAALALELDLEAPSLPDWTGPVAPPQLGAGSHPLYEPDFTLLDRGIVGRAALDATPLVNNAPIPMNLAPGASACYVVQKSVIFSGGGNAGSSSSSRELKRDEDVERRAEHAKQPSDKDEGDGSSTKTLYLSANTCLQPQVASSDGASEVPPQLRIYISTSSKDGCPDPTKPAAGVQSKAFEQGAVTYGLNVTGDVYVTVAAPKVTDKFQGIYNFEIAASVDAYYYQYSSQNGQLLWMDSDATSALLQTASLTNDRSQIPSIMKAAPQYDLFVQGTKAPILDGLMRSVCGMNNVAQIASKRLDDGQMNNNEVVRTKMTDKGPGGWPRQQFYFQGLNSSTSYYGILVKRGNSTASSKRQGTAAMGGGGIVFPPTDFQTSAGTNCNLITDLDFCEDVQWAAPGNNKYNNTELGNLYDAYAKAMYGNFQKVMMQIPCEAPSTQRYSLAANCDNCTAAYKQWLCAVAIPRCEDFSTQSNYTIPRNAAQAFPNGTFLPDALRQELMQTPAFNTSRTSFIDEVIAPGPYKEILPCADLCYGVVQGCPAAIGFGCPRPGKLGFNVSYALRDRNGGAVSCNYPGEPRTQVSASGATTPSLMLVIGALGLGSMLLL
ncbi:Calcium influx-promoting protein ehs1 [Trichoderma ghanense]|uniref:Calcium influx-promoting protein ehs1 n=1 Tax=Trichoderma ghanense TaxID=65468 RepID=A0ABY2HBP2_9HYPO